MIKYILLFLVLLLFGSNTMNAQFSESKERQKMWKKSKKRHKNRQSFNPYLDKKEKPSQKLSKQNARDQKKQLRAAKKQKRGSMKKLGIKRN